MFRKKKCQMCNKKTETTGTRVIPGMGAMELCDSCKGFADGPGDRPSNPARIPICKPMGYRAPTKR